MGDARVDAVLYNGGALTPPLLAERLTQVIASWSGPLTRLSNEAPDLAAPFLFSIGKTLVARIRADNKRYRDSVNFARTAQQ